MSRDSHGISIATRLASVVVECRGARVVIAVWLVASGVGFLLQVRLDDVTAAGQSSFLPAHSQSTRAFEGIKRAFPRGDSVPTLVVFEHPGGLTRSDRVEIGRIGNRPERLRLGQASPAFDPFVKSGRESGLGRVGLLSLPATPPSWRSGSMQRSATPSLTASQSSVSSSGTSPCRVCRRT